MLSKVPYENLFFLDIETVPLHRHFDELDPEWQNLWEKKSKYTRDKEELTLEESYKKAGLYAEFGKIICISVGFLVHHPGTQKLHVKSFFGHDEKSLLENFANLLRANPNKSLCAHNGKGFDFPFVAKRMTVLGRILPTISDIIISRFQKNMIF